MNYKKIVALSSAILICSMNLIGCTNKKENAQSNNNNAIKVGMVTDVGGINDKSL